jgi:hypothetical protein
VRSITTDTPGVLARHFRDLDPADSQAIVADNAASLYAL